MPTKPKQPKIKVIDEDKRQAGLSSFSDLSPEERRRLAALGGKKSGESKRAAKTFKEAVEFALNLPAIKGNPTVDKLLKAYPDLTNREAMAIAMTAEAVKKQNVKAFVALRDTTGELPAQTVNIEQSKPMNITIKTVE